jgi:nucleoside-diphosphate-sugar epimerase
MKRVLILGSNGRLGASVTKAFVDVGWDVLAQRRTSGQGALPAGATEVVVDLLEVGCILSLVGSVDVIVHAANPPYADWRRASAALLDATIAVAKSTGATILFPGNIYNFGPTQPGRLLEDTPQHPVSKKGQIRAQLERMLQQAASEGVRSCVLRAGDFFGSGSGSWFDLATVKDITKGKVTTLSPSNTKHSWAYVPDLARTFVRVAEARETLPAFSVMNFSGHTITMEEMRAALERATGRTMTLKRFPWAFIRAASLFVPRWRELHDLRYMWEMPHEIVAGAVAKSLAAPVTPLDVALAQSLSALAQCKS